MRRPERTSYVRRVGYDIGFLSPSQGDEEDASAERLPLQLTDEQQSAWRRIVSRARDEIGTAREDQYPTHLELRLDNPAMQLWYTGKSISIEVPYWYTTTAASAHHAIATAYALARIVEAETGMRGVDYEVNQAVRNDGLPRAVARYRRVGQHVRALAEGKAPQAGRDSGTDVERS